MIVSHLHRSLLKSVARGDLFYTLIAAGVLTTLPPLYASDSSPPEIENVRYTENYSYLGKTDPKAAAMLSPWDSFKYVPITRGGDAYITLGTELRLRYERYEDNNWGDGGQDTDGYFWTRALPLIDVHLGQHVRAFGQTISALAHDLDLSTSLIDENQLDLLQGFAEFRLPLYEADALVVRPGRQLLTYGSGRLIDIRYGPNVLQSFDALKSFVETDRWQVDVFYARPVDHRLGVFDDGTEDRQSLWSIYTTVKATNILPTSIDLYYIGYLNKDAEFTEISGRELRHTLGARVFGEKGEIDWNFEFFYQFGEFDTRSETGAINAWSVASDTGYTFQDAPSLPRLGLRANIVSGDRDRRDLDVETFNPLFPKGKYFGELSPIGPANLVHINPYATIRLTDKLQLSGNVGFYWRQSKNDGVYALGGMDILRPDNGSDSRYIGTQAELLLEYQPTRHFSAATSYSVFTAGPFIEDTGRDEAIQLFAFEWVYRF